MGAKLPTFVPPRNMSQRTNKLRGYDAAWRRLRLRKLRVNPICEACHERPAEEVDHIDADTSNRSWGNLQSMCHPCHSRKTVRCDGGLRGKAT